MVIIFRNIFFRSDIVIKRILIELLVGVGSFGCSGNSLDIGIFEG